MRYINPEWIRKIRVEESGSGFRVELSYHESTSDKRSDSFTFKNQDEVAIFMKRLGSTESRFIDLDEIGEPTPPIAYEKIL